MVIMVKHVGKDDILKTLQARITSEMNTKREDTPPPDDAFYFEGASRPDSKKHARPETDGEDSQAPKKARVAESRGSAQLNVEQVAIEI